MMVKGRGINNYEGLVVGHAEELHSTAQSAVEQVPAPGSVCQVLKSDQDSVIPDTHRQALDAAAEQEILM